MNLQMTIDFELFDPLKQQQLRASLSASSAVEEKEDSSLPVSLSFAVANVVQASDADGIRDAIATIYTRLCEQCPGRQPRVRKGSALHMLASFKLYAHGVGGAPLATAQLHGNMHFHGGLDRLSATDVEELLKKVKEHKNREELRDALFSDYERRQAVVKVHVLRDELLAIPKPGAIAVAAIWVVGEHLKLQERVEELEYAVQELRVRCAPRATNEMMANQAEPDKRQKDEDPRR